jgi:hypothetical protein
MLHLAFSINPIQIAKNSNPNAKLGLSLAPLLDFSGIW